MRIEPSDITVLTPLVSYENTDPIWMFLTTCRRFGITPTFYGQGETYAGWVDIMLRKLMYAVKDCPTSHVLYTDSRDAFFLAGLEEIAAKYNAMGCPPLLMGADRVGFSSYQNWYDKVPWNMAKEFKYFQVGGKLCEAKALYEALQWMFMREKSGDWGEMPGDNPPWWCNFMAERPGELQIDHYCQIFQNCTNAERYLAHEPDLAERIVNLLTGSNPCILHFNGGYTDQKTGKWYCMEKIWRELGYKENPPWQTK